ncbi:hypothetical protein ACIGHN_27645 [Acidovorax sp. NPDC077693]|uniref:hypothetical protein n=1 Tax=unclassified Acidovorax TaxID=2684926 RepID=UPI0037C65575
MKQPDFNSAPDIVGPLLVTATNVRYLMDFPDGSEKLYSADVELRRGESLLRRFEAILFSEGSSAALIYGVEFEDGYPKGLAREFATEQQRFISFLRLQNHETNVMLGSLSGLFSSLCYSSELLVTRAFLAGRNSSLDALVGYRDNQTGKYVHLIVGSDDA